MGSIRVIGDMVTLKVRDAAGAAVLANYYKGAVVRDVFPESVEHHVAKGLVERLEEPKAPKAPAKTAESSAAKPKKAAAKKAAAGK